MDHTSQSANAASTQDVAPKSLWVFFISCLKISAFTFGGGYVIVPMQKRRFCDELGWIDEETILDLVSIAQSSPGPVAINASTLMGYHLFSYPGALLATLATILPPLVILSIISIFYKLFAQNALVRAVLQGMKAAVSALILFTGLKLINRVLQRKSIFYTCLLAADLGLAIFTELNIIWIILLTALVSIVAYLVKMPRKGEPV